jgi:hypothetical protein
VDGLPAARDRLYLARSRHGRDTRACAIAGGARRGGRCLTAYTAINKEIASHWFLAVFVILVAGRQLVSGQLAGGLEVGIVGVLFPDPSSA